MPEKKTKQKQARNIHSSSKLKKNTPTILITQGPIYPLTHITNLSMTN